jgi:programmed cell death protein 5
MNQNQSDEEAKQKYLQAMKEQQEKMRVEMEFDSALRKLLTPEAKSRLANVRMVNPELHAKAVQALVYFARSGKISDKISDSQMKEILSKMTGEKKETKITWK